MRHRCTTFSSVPEVPVTAMQQLAHRETRQPHQDRPTSGSDSGSGGRHSDGHAGHRDTSGHATDIAPAAWAERGDDRRRLKTSDHLLIDRAIRGFEVLQGKWKVHLIVAMARGIRRPSRSTRAFPASPRR